MTDAIAPESDGPSKGRAPAGGVSRALAIVAVLIAGLALAAAAVLWQRLARTQEELARRSADLQAEVAAVRALADQAQATVADLQARLGAAEVKLSEVSLQRSQLEELMLSVSRSRDDSLVQDLEAALRLAIQQSELTGSVQPLVTALQGAQKRIERAAQPRLNPVQRAIARDLERIQMAALVDVPALVMRLDELARAVSEWPLRGGEPLHDEAAAPAAPTPPSNAPLPANADADTVWARVWASLQQGLEAGWRYLLDATQDLVRLSRIEQPESVLLAPEQAYFLRENIRLLLLNARLGVLARQFDSARADVRAVERHLLRYFVAESPTMQQTIDTLRCLQRDLQQGTLPRPDETLAALATAAEGR